MKYGMSQQVALARNIPEKNLQRGDIATIVESHPATGGEPGYTIEVFNAIGQTIVVTTVPENFLQKLTADEVFHVRPLAETR
jgi:hypothetical protein